MVALAFGLLLVMMTTAVLLADMERKRRTIVDLIEQLAPMIGRKRRLTMANLRRLSRSPVHAYSLIDPLEREIGLIEGERGITPPAGSRSLFAGSRLTHLEERLRILTAVTEATAATDAVAVPDTGPAR